MIGRYNCILLTSVASVYTLTSTVIITDIIIKSFREKLIKVTHTERNTRRDEFTTSRKRLSSHLVSLYVVFISFYLFIYSFGVHSVVL